MKRGFSFSISFLTNKKRLIESLFILDIYYVRGSKTVDITHMYQCNNAHVEKTLRTNI